MSLNCIKFNANSKTDSKVVCHSIPCKVKTDCEAEVDKYFEPTIRQSDKEVSVLLSSFRGRPLVGRQIDLPENSLAFVVKANKANELTASEGFRRITHWNLDKTPSADDSLPQVIDWIQISNAIHSPIGSNRLSDKK